jgi:hypothetical protein
MTLQLRSEIFKETVDYSNWDKYIEYIKRNPELEEAKRAILAEIYTFLKAELGKDYIGKCYTDGKNLVNHWLTSKGFYYSELNWLYDSLAYFKNTNCNYIKLLGHLISNKKCNLEGIPFLIAGDSLRKAGFNVVFEPEVDHVKKPDLKIINPLNGEIVYGEISKLNESDPREKSGLTYNMMMHVFMHTGPTIPFAGKIERAGTRDELEKVHKYIFSKKQKAWEEKIFIKIGLDETDGIAECAVAHPDKESEIKEWEKNGKYSGIGQIRGLALDFDETPRIIQKILKEAPQIPPDYPGIIYIPLTPLYFMYCFDLTSATDKIRQTLSKYLNILGVCLYSHLGNQSEPMGFIEHDFFQRKMVHGNTQQDFLFVLNKNCNLKVYPDTLMKLYSSFLNVYE